MRSFAEFYVQTHKNNSKSFLYEEAKALKLGKKNFLVFLSSHYLKPIQNATRKLRI